MKVATKFALAFLGCGVLTVLAYSWVAATREAQAMEETVAEDLASLGHTLSHAVLATWERGGEDQALTLVRYADRDERIEVRWTWLGADAKDSFAPRVDSASLVDVRSGATRTSVVVRADGTRVVYAYLPLLRRGERPAALELARPLVSRSHVFWTEIREQLAASAAVAGIATALAVLLTTWLVSRPLAEVAEQARRIGRGDLSHRLPVHGSNEVSCLVRDLNAMCDQLRDAGLRADDAARKRMSTLDQLRHADRLRTVGTLATGLAHELGTPLAVIAMRAKLIASGEVSLSEAPEGCSVIATQAERLTVIVRQLLDFARRRVPTRTEVNLREVAERAASLLSSLAKKSRVDIVLDPNRTPVYLKADGAQIEQAVTNLVINAVQAMPNGGTVRVSTRKVLAAPKSVTEADSGVERECVVIEVTDDGQGIPESDLERIFEPFFTTKGVGEGTGLGLSVTHGILEDHEGWMTVASELGRGSTFRLVLPLGLSAATSGRT